MKYILFFFTAIISFKCFSQNTIPVLNILEAIDKKTISYTSSGRYDQTNKTSYTDADGQYFGKSMQIELHNNSDDSVYIYIPEGLMLLSEDTIVQDMLITKPLYALLAPKKTNTFALYAMCSEIHDGVPSTRENYKITRNTDENLITIAKTIRRSYMQNVIGQGAVWAWTDNASVKDLKRYGATDETIEITLNLLAKAGVKTKLAEELNFIAPAKIESNKDSIIQALNTKLNYANTVLKFKAQDFELKPVIVYGGIGLIVVLIGTSTYFAMRKRKDTLS